MKARFVILKLYRFLLFVLIIVSFNRCNLCEDCGGNKLQPILNNLPYSNNEPVKFSNNGNIVTDTVKIYYAKPSDEYNCNGKENTNDCAGTLAITIGDFTIGYFQGDYARKGLYGPSCVCKDGNLLLTDSLDYNYKGQIIKAYVYSLDTTKITYKNQAYIDVDFYVSKNNRLLQYAIKRNGILETWVENE